MRLLVIRLSALGDVAMTVPVIDTLAKQYQQLEITVLSKPFVAPMFAEMPANVRFQGVDLTQYKGIAGLFRLFCELKKGKYDAVADLHDVLRSRVLRVLFRLSGVRTAHIDKGRKEKKALSRREHKVMHQLPSSFNRYEKVFEALGYPVNTEFRSIYGERKGDTALFKSIVGLPDGKHWIGFAPFAAHSRKMLPRATISTFIQKLATDHADWRIFLFGAGKAEQELMENWSADCLNVQVLAGKLKLKEELALISHLDVMVSMDSANMHLASLAGTPVVSVWGATHPFAGFMGWKQTADNAVQIDLPCRPCSIYGNKPCYRKDYACLQGITPEMIIEKIVNVIDASGQSGYHNTSEE